MFMSLRKHVSGQQFWGEVLQNSYHQKCKKFTEVILHTGQWNLNNGAYQGHIDGLVQERRNYGVLAMELCLSCTDPSILCCIMLYYDIIPVTLYKILQQ